MINLHLRPISFYLKLLALVTLATPLSIILLAGFWLTAGLTNPLKHLICCETPASFGATYESIQFTTADGLKLSGWYIPPQNGAVVILVHSYYSDRRQTLPVAAMLSRHGYGLLLYDQRASGESQGETRSLGRLDIPDLAQAVNFVVIRQKNIKVGAYGCSMGGAIALAGAGSVPEIQAIAVDAPSPLSWDENNPGFNLKEPFNLPVTLLYYQLVGLRAQALPPVSSLQAIQNYGNRPILLISTGRGAEFARVLTLLERASGPKEHWNLPDSSHCAAASTHPTEYEQHLVEFFDTYLLRK